MNHSEAIESPCVLEAFLRNWNPYQVPEVGVGELQWLLVCQLLSTIAYQGLDGCQHLHMDSPRKCVEVMKKTLKNQTS